MSLTLSVEAPTLFPLWMQGFKLHAGPSRDRIWRRYDTRIAAFPLVHNREIFHSRTFEIAFSLICRPAATARPAKKHIQKTFFSNPKKGKDVKVFMSKYI